VRLELDRLHDRQVRGLLALENAAGALAVVHRELIIALAARC
jgi:hypothetical protein